MAEETEPIQSEMTQPIIIDLGTEKSSKLKDLKKGKGELWDDILNVVDETREMLGNEAEGKVFVPVILIYKRKPKRASLQKLIFPFAK